MSRGRNPILGNTPPSVGSERTAEDRDAIADDRDRIAAAHDEVAELRDARATARDARAAAREALVGRLDPAAVTDRAGARRDRQGSATDRINARNDRLAAADDRATSADERRLFLIDGLTGARRRDAGMMELEREISRAKRTRQSFVLAFIDVDGLKVINDSRGHAAGDQLLAQVAAAVRSHVRPYDLIVRYGGDEFLCGLLDLRIEDTVARFALVNDRLARECLASVTVGLAELTADDDLRDLIDRADAALYLEARRPICAALLTLRSHLGSRHRVSDLVGSGDRGGRTGRPPRSGVGALREPGSSRTRTSRWCWPTSTSRRLRPGRS